MPRALADHVTAGHAILSIYANDPDQLKDAPADLVATLQEIDSPQRPAVPRQISRNRTNWAVVAAAATSWAARVFPEIEPSQQVDRLWDAISCLCRLDHADPIAAWETHLRDLAARTDLLNDKQYTALRYTRPGHRSDDRPRAGHQWVGGSSVNAAGIRFAPNLPTEEVFTMPHKDRVNGTVRSTKPLSYGGTLIENFS